MPKKQVELTGRKLERKQKKIEKKQKKQMSYLKRHQLLAKPKT